MILVPHENMENTQYILEKAFLICLKHFLDKIVFSMFEKDNADTT